MISLCKSLKGRLFGLKVCLGFRTGMRVYGFES